MRRRVQMVAAVLAILFTGVAVVPDKMLPAALACDVCETYRVMTTGLAIAAGAVSVALSGAGRTDASWVARAVGVVFGAQAFASRFLDRQVDRIERNVRDRLGRDRGR